MTNQIVILAGGKGTRMKSGNVPKVLVMLKQKPLILHLLHELEKIRQLAKPVVVVGYKYQDVKAVLGEDYTYAFQSQQLGTAHALECAKPKVKAKNILVLYGDMPFIKAKSLKTLLALHLKKNAKISICTTEVKDFRGKYESMKHFGKIVRNSQGKIAKIVEYKNASVGQKKITEVNPGIYMFNTEWLWQALKGIKTNSVSGEYYLTDIVAVAINQGLEVFNSHIEPLEVIGVNTKEDLAVAEKVAQVAQ
jgi:bifunctional UDP-N-acetylglucosamine pyrophosphorylase / glucosamine-1-phosphate N-acetyltransferase